MDKIKKVIMPDGEELAVRDKELEDGSYTDEDGKKYFDIDGKHLRTDNSLYAKGLRIVNADPCASGQNMTDLGDMNDPDETRVVGAFTSDGSLQARSVEVYPSASGGLAAINSHGGHITSDGGHITSYGGSISSYGGDINAGSDGSFSGKTYSTLNEDGAYRVSNDAVFGRQSLKFNKADGAVVVDGSLVADVPDEGARKLWLGVISTAQKAGIYPSATTPEAGIIARLASDGKKYVDVYAERMVGRTEGARCEFDVVRGGVKLVLVDSEGNAYDVNMDTLKDFLSKSEGGTVSADVTVEGVLKAVADKIIAKNIEGYAGIGIKGSNVTVTGTTMDEEGNVVAGDVNISGNIGLGGGTVTVTNNLNTHKVIPTANDTYVLGQSGARYAEVNAKTGKFDVISIAGHGEIKVIETDLWISATDKVCIPSLSVQSVTGAAVDETSGGTKDSKKIITSGAVHSAFENIVTVMTTDSTEGCTSKFVAVVEE